MIDVSVVIVTYKVQPEVLRACFRHLAASEGVGLEVIVVDNEGSETVKSLLLSEVPHALYIANNENRGFAAAVNQGIKISRGRFVLLLNPDTEVPATALRDVVAHMDAEPGVGVGSTLITYPDGSLQESIRRFPTLRDQVVTLLKLPHFLKRIPSIDRYMMRDVDPYTTQDVDSIMGAFMMIRRDVIDRVGLFDERYFIWFEEVDYCKMVKNAGYRIRHYADVRIVHHKGHTFNQVATLRKQKWVRESMRKYMYKHHGLWQALILWACAPVFIVLAYLAAVAKRG